MEKTRLQEVAKELNDLLGLDPAINVEAEDAEISVKVCEAVQLLEKGDKLSDDSVSTLMELEQVEHLKRAGLVKEAREKKVREKKEKKRTFTMNMVESFTAKVTLAQAVQNMVNEFAVSEQEAKRRIISHAKWCVVHNISTVVFDRAANELKY